MMSDLASSIMRRRASIEAHDDDDDDDDGGESGRRSGGVLGLRAYLAAKDTAQKPTDNDDWE